MFLVGFPLLIIALAFYNIFAFLIPVEWSRELATVPLMSKVIWKLTLGDAMLASALFLLFIEVVKAARAGRSIVDHLLSILVFGGAAAEFLLVPQAATSVFAILLAICLFDVIGGLAIGRRAPKSKAPEYDDHPPPQPSTP